MADGSGSDDALRRKLAELEAMQREVRAMLDERAAPQPATQIQVPTTPPRKRPVERPVEVMNIKSPKMKSPKRVALKIDKGLKAKDVNLRRPKPTSSSSFATRVISAEKEALQEKLIQEKLLEQRVGAFGLPSNVNKHDSAPESDKDCFEEPYSGLRLSKQYVDSELLKREFEGKEILSITRVYAVVHPPKFIPPEHANFVVLGIVAKKSDVKQNKLGHKFIMMTLTDLKYDIVLAMHGTAFDQFWKIREGTLVAILNPSFYVYKQQVNNAPGSNTVGMTVTSDLDVILEVGRAKDVGQCSATTQKGTRCTQWINTAKATYCDFHVEVGVRRTGRARMDVNSAPTKLFSPKKNGQRLHFVKGPVAAKSGLQPDPMAPRPDNLFGNQGRVFMTGASSKTIAGFMDDYDSQPITSQQASQKLQKRLQAHEAESKIRKKLAQMPGGYLLKEYDVKGRVLDEDGGSVSTAGTSDSPFSAREIRRLGFDPAKRPTFTKDLSIGKNSATEVNLKRPKPAPIDADDDLEII